MVCLIFLVATYMRDLWQDNIAMATPCIFMGMATSPADDRCCPECAAFDKTDLLYLRDQEEKSRHTEMELHDREVTTYAELRARAERERRTDLRSQPPPPRRDKAKCGFAIRYDCDHSQWRPMYRHRRFHSRSGSSFKGLYPLLAGRQVV